MILYFSGTGNSRYAALRLGELTGEPVNSINQCLKEGAAIGLHSKNHYVVVSPVYAWRLPRVVERFIRQASFSGNTGIYFVLTCGDDVGNAAKYARRLCAKKGLRFCGLEPLVMPENYITMYQAPGREEAEQMIRRAEPELERFALSGAEGYVGRPGEEQPCEPAVLPAVRERQGILCGGGLRGLRPLREALSAEQYPSGERQACLGQEMHPVYGLHLRMPGPGCGVWKANSGEGAVLSDGEWDVRGGGGRAGVARCRPAAGGRPGAG